MSATPDWAAAPTTQTTNTTEESTAKGFVDLNDPNLTGADLTGFDPNAEPAGRRVLAGTYNVKLDYQEQEDPTRRWRVYKQGEKGQFYGTRLSGRVVNADDSLGGYVRDDFVTTMVFKDGTCGAANVIKAVHGKDAVAGLKTDIELVKKLNASLPGIVKAVVEVRAYEKGYNKPFIKRQADFPQDDRGNPDFDKVIADGGPEEGGQVYIRSEIVRYIV